MPIETTVDAIFYWKYSEHVCQVALATTVYYSMMHSDAIDHASNAENFALFSPIRALS
jgi:hypothetical protein